MTYRLSNRSAKADAKPSRPARRSRAMAGFLDYAGVLAAVAHMVWHHRLWWMIPLLLSLAFLGVLMFLGATPAGPLVYPVF